MVVIIAHQQTITLAALGKAATVIIPLLNLAASGIGGLRGIDHDAFLAITVKVTGHDVQEAAVGVGGHLKAISVIHVCKSPMSTGPLRSEPASCLVSMTHR